MVSPTASCAFAFTVILALFKYAPRAFPGIPSMVRFLCDIVGDTMNEGKILIRGNIGDAAGYAMRGGKIYVQGNAGYRAGIHMKAYKENPASRSASFTAL